MVATTGKIGRAGVQMLLASTLVLWACPAFAEWKAECTPDKMTDKPHCSLITTVTSRPSMEFIGVGYEANMIAISGGSPLSQTRIRVDSNAAIVTRDCSGQFCIVPEAQKGGLLKQMRTGSKLLVEITNVRGQTIGPLETSLSGFDAGFQTMK